MDQIEDDVRSIKVPPATPTPTITSGCTPTCASKVQEQ
jgi:hypothetical protein